MAGRLMDPDELEAAGMDDSQVVGNTVQASAPNQAPAPGESLVDFTNGYPDDDPSAEPDFKGITLGLPVAGAQRMLGEEAKKVSRMSKADAGRRDAITGDQQKAEDLKANVEYAIAKDPETVLANADLVRASEAHKSALARSVELRNKALNQFDVLDKMSTDLANQRVVDPWANRSMGDKLFSIAAQAFGGFVSGAFGGPNIPAQMIDQAIRQDLAIQRWNMQHGEDSLKNKQGLLRQMMDHFQDVDTAEAAAYMASTDSINKRMDLVASKYKGAKILAAANATKAELAKLGEDKREGLKQHFEQTQADLKKAEAQLASNKYAVDAATARQQMKPGPAPLTFTEYDGVARNAKEYADVQKIHDVDVGFASGVERLSDFITHMDRSNVQDQMILKSQLAGLFSEMRVLEGTGANLSANEEQNINAQLPGLFSGNVAPELFQAKLQDLADRQILKALKIAKSRGFAPNQQNQLLQLYYKMHPEAAGGQ